MLEQDVVNQICANLIESLTEKTIERATRFTKDQVERYNAKSISSFKKYYENTIQNTINVKNLVYHNLPVNLYSFYTHLELGFEKLNLSTESVENLLRLEKNIIITGIGGSGKSTLFRHLVINTITSAEMLPILVEFKEFNRISIDRSFDLVDYICNKIYTNRSGISREIFEMLLEDNRIILFLDAYDELDNDKKGDFYFIISDFVNKYKSCRVIMSSRPDSSFQSWNTFFQLPINELSLEQATTLVSNLFYEEEIKMEFVDKIEFYYEGPHGSFLRSPLLLTIMLISYNDFREVPNNIHDFYSQAFESLFSKHDKRKAGFTRKTLTMISKDCFLKIFSSFSLLTYVDNRTEFKSFILYDYFKKTIDILSKTNNIDICIDDLIDDITNIFCLFTNDGKIYQFTHRSFQEYFAAYNIHCKLEYKQVEVLDYIQENRGLQNGDLLFGMLYEMNRSRMEVNYILPYYQEIFRKVSIPCDSSQNDICIIIVRDVFEIVANPSYYKYQIENHTNINFAKLTLYLTALSHHYDLSSINIKKLPDNEFQVFSQQIDRFLIRSDVEIIDERFKTPALLAFAFSNPDLISIIYESYQLYKHLSKKYKKSISKSTIESLLT